MTKKIFYLKEIIEKIPFSEEEIMLFCEEGLIEVFKENDTIYFHDDVMERLEIIKRLNYELGVNLECIDVILHMRKKILNIATNTEISTIVSFFKINSKLRLNACQKISLCYGWIGVRIFMLPPVED